MKSTTATKIIGFILGTIVASPLWASEFDFNEGWKFQQGDSPSANWRVSPRNIRPYMAAATGEDLLKNPSKKWAGGTTPEGLEWSRSDFDDSGWTSLDLPHDWAIREEFSENNDPTESFLPCSGTGWYRKSFDVPESDRGKKYFLDFDGVMSYAAVWVNGKFAGGWPYGYTSFRVDATPYLVCGKSNIVAVRVDHPAQTSRWYTGGGIYRNVRLVVSEPVRIDRWGVCVRTEDVSRDAATLNISVATRNETDSPKTIRLETSIYRRDFDGRKTGESIAVARSAETTLEPRSTQTVSLEKIVLTTPELWSPERPATYLAETTLKTTTETTAKTVSETTAETPLQTTTDEATTVEATTDVSQTAFGVRTVEFTPDRGMLLNGTSVKLKGCCLHHDLGPLGAAVNVRAMERQLDLLKEAGCNAIRLSHNPAAPEMMDLLDRKGFLVQAEAFDQWTRPGGFWRSAGYCELFDEWHEKDLRSLVRRDRNHPSVVMWSIGNEIPELQSDTPLFIKLATELCAIVHEEDPTRPTTSACNARGSGFNGVQNVLDLFGYNYYGRSSYEEFREKNPDKAVYGSETVCAMTTRGYYLFPIEKRWMKGIADYSYSSYGWQACDWNPDKPLEGWAAPPDVEFATQEKYPWVCGEFIWTGIDYLGAPYYVGALERSSRFTDPELERTAAEQKAKYGIARCPARVCECGLLDTAGFPKDPFWLYRSVWRPDVPTARLLPHWNWLGREGEIVPVDLLTSGDEAELFLNGRSLGRKKKGEYEYRLSWEVRYEPGELKSVAYKNGEEWATDAVQTTGNPARLRLTADRSAIDSDGKDLAFITCDVLDAEGRFVPTAKNEIRFKISQGGRIVATDNGDGRDWTSYASPSRRAFAGKALCVVAFDKNASEPIRLVAESDGLNSASVEIVPR